MDRNKLDKLYQELGAARQSLDKANDAFSIGWASYQEVKDAEWLISDIELKIDKAEIDLGEWRCYECGKWVNSIDHRC